METQITPLGNGYCEAVARLELHYPDGVECRVYELTLRIEEATLNIVEASAPIFFAENEACNTTVRLVEQLVGLNILEKYTWRIHRIFGSSSGCQHLLELSEEIGRTWFNRMTSRGQKRMERPPVDLRIIGEQCAGLRVEVQKYMEEGA
jgi:hypothetical protein